MDINHLIFEMSVQIFGVIDEQQSSCENLLVSPNCNIVIHQTPFGLIFKEHGLFLVKYMKNLVKFSEIREIQSIDFYEFDKF